METSDDTFDMPLQETSVSGAVEAAGPPPSKKVQNVLILAVLLVKTT